MAEFAQKRANSAIATFALVTKLCKFHICNIFAPGKFGASSIFHPVRVKLLNTFQNDLTSRAQVIQLNMK